MVALDICAKGKRVRLFVNGVVVSAMERDISSVKVFVKRVILYPFEEACDSCVFTRVRRACSGHLGLKGALL